MYSISFSTNVVIDIYVINSAFFSQYLYIPIYVINKYVILCQKYGYTKTIYTPVICGTCMKFPFELIPECVVLL